MGSGPVAASNQGQTISLPANTPVQIPIAKGGITLISESGNAITLSTDENFTSAPVMLPANASLPWPEGGVLWALSTTATTVKVMQGTYNYWNPSVVVAPNAPTPLINTVLSNAGGSLILQPLIPFLTRTLVIQIYCTPGGATGVANVKIEGNTSRFSYYNQAPYLYSGSADNIYTVVVPYSGFTEPSQLIVNITLSGSLAGNTQVTIWADTAQYDESVFYNGRIQAKMTSIAGIGSQTLINGPVRLLTAALQVTGSMNAQINNGGGFNLLRGDTASNNVPVFPVLNFPSNTILMVGDTLILNCAGWVAGFATAQVTYAYP